MCISRASVATEFHDNGNPRLSTPATSARSTRRQLMVAFISSIEQIQRLTFFFFNYFWAGYFGFSSEIFPSISLFYLLNKMEDFSRIRGDGTLW